jgi:hypothetical protein
VGEQAEGDVAVPGVPSPYLVVVHAHLALGLGEALFHRSAVLANPDEFLDRRPLGTVGLVEAAVLGIIGAPADQEPTPHPLLGIGR